VRDLDDGPPALERVRGDDAALARLSLIEPGDKGAALGHAFLLEPREEVDERVALGLVKRRLEVDERVALGFVGRRFGARRGRRAIPGPGRRRRGAAQGDQASSCDHR